MRFIKQLSAKLVQLQAMTSLAILYVTLVPVFVLVRRLFQREKPTRGWTEWKLRSETIADLRRQW